MDGILKVIKERRSIRKFKPEQIKEEELSEILEAGLYAPSAKGMQTPVFVVIQGEENMDAAVSLNAKVWGKEGNPYFGAPTLILTFASGDIQITEYDCAAATQNMLLAAHALGLGTCWINREKEMFETPEGKELMERWGVPEGYVGVSGIALGYPAVPNPEAAERKRDRIKRV